MRSGNDPPTFAGGLALAWDVGLLVGGGVCEVFGWLDFAEVVRVELLTVTVGFGGSGSVAACGTGCGRVGRANGGPDVQATAATTTPARTSVRPRRRA
jgi:hypothetical protein